MTEKRSEPLLGEYVNSAAMKQAADAERVPAPVPSWRPRGIRGSGAGPAEVEFSAAAARVYLGATGLRAWRILAAAQLRSPAATSVSAGG